MHPNSAQFTSRRVPLFTGPTYCLSAYSWNHQVPRVPLRAQGVTSRAVAALATSAGVTPPSSLLRTRAPVLPPPSAYGHCLGQRVLAGRCQPRLAVAPSRRYSANLSLRAWTPTPAAPVVLLPVSSHQTTASPALGPGRRLATPIQQLQYGRDFGAAVIRSCSGPQVCSPPRPLPPRRCSATSGRGFSFRASRDSLPPRAPDMLAVRVGD